MPDDEPIYVESVPDVGSERLAEALEAGDWAAIGQALRHDFVVLPLIETDDGETQNRVFPSNDESGEKPYALALFSSTRTLALFLGDDDRRLFALVRGPGLVPFLKQHHGVLHRVHFDPAGPHAVSADIDDTLRALEPQLLDDDVAWASTPSGETDALPAGAPRDRAIAIDTPLGRDWAVVDVTDADTRRWQVRELLDAQLGGFLNRKLRAEFEAWSTRASELAVRAGGRFLAVLIRRDDKAAAVVNLALYWHELGSAIGEASHLERMSERLRGGLAEGDELVGAETPAGPFVRHTHLGGGAAEPQASDRPVLVVDYWLAFPDGRGLARYSFSSPSIEQRDALVVLFDDIVDRARWVTDRGE